MTARAAVRKPPLPAEFRRISNAMGLYYVVHGLVAWLGAALLALWVYEQAAWPLLLRVALAAPLLVVAGFGMFHLGSLGHEGFHGNLHRRRHVSMMLGMAASTATPGFCSVGLNVYHWRHHAHTNTAADPDYQLYRGRHTLRAKLAGPLATCGFCLRNTVRLLAGRERLEQAFPFSVAAMRGFAVVNVLMVVVVTATWAWLLATAPAAFVFVLALPASIGALYWTLHPYIEHAQTGGTARDYARDTTAPVLRWLLLGYTYHHCHHLYPGVQSHRLPKLREHLLATGFLDARSPTQSSLAGALRLGLTRSID